MWNIKQRSEEIQSLRKKLRDAVDKDTLESLDESVNLAFITLGIAVAVIAIRFPEAGVLVGVLNVFFTLVTWFSYKIAKIKHAVDLRLLVIAIAVQAYFFFVLLVAAALAWGHVYSMAFLDAHFGALLQFVVLMILMAVCSLILVRSDWIGIRTIRWVWKRLTKSANEEEESSIVRHRLMALEPVEHLVGKAVTNVPLVIAFLILLLIAEPQIIDSSEEMALTLLFIILLPYALIQYIRYGTGLTRALKLGFIENLEQQLIKRGWKTKPVNLEHIFSYEGPEYASRVVRSIASSTGPQMIVEYSLIVRAIRCPKNEPTEPCLTVSTEPAPDKLTLLESLQEESLALLFELEESIADARHVVLKSVSGCVSREYSHIIRQLDIDRMDTYLEPGLATDRIQRILPVLVVEGSLTEVLCDTDDNEQEIPVEHIIITTHVKQWSDYAEWVTVHLVSLEHLPGFLESIIRVI